MVPGHVPSIKGKYVVFPPYCSVFTLTVCGAFDLPTQREINYDMMLLLQTVMTYYKQILYT